MSFHLISSVSVYGLLWIFPLWWPKAPRIHLTGSSGKPLFCFPVSRTVTWAGKRDNMATLEPLTCLFCLNAFVLWWFSFSTLTRWLEVKLGGGEKIDESLIESEGKLKTLVISNSLRDIGQKTHKVHLCIKVRPSYYSVIWTPKKPAEC